MSSTLDDENVGIFRFSLELIKFRPKPFIIKFIGSIIFFLIPFAIAMIIREIFNNLVGKPFTDLNIWTLIFLIPLFYFIMILVDITNVIAEFSFILSAQVLMRSNILEGVFNQPGADSLQNSSGESISRFRGDPREFIKFTNFLATLSAFAIFTVISFSLMYTINSRVTITVFIPFIVVIYVVNKFRGKVANYRRVRRAAAGRVTGAVAEVFNSIQAIKVSTSEDNIVKYFDELNEKRRVASIKDSVFSTFLRSFGIVVVAFSTGLILFLIGQEMKNGTFTIGDFTLFTFLLGWIQGFIRDMGEFIAWNQRSRVSYQRMYRLMKGNKKETERKELVKHKTIYIKKPFPTIPAIKKLDDSLVILEVQKLNYIFPRTANGITNINFKIKKGSFNVITGKIGSGKTTLLRTVLGLLPAQTGIIKWNGSIVEQPADFFIPPVSSYTAQVPRLFSESIQENLQMGLPEDLPKMEEATKLAVIYDEIKSFENEFQSLVGPRGMKLSGGQKQRIAAARMFIHHSELIVVDDISSALDVETEKTFWEGIFEKTNSTFLIVSHRKSVLRRADQIIILKNGEINGQGKLADLLKANEEMQNLWSGKLKVEITAKVESSNP